MRRRGIGRSPIGRTSHCAVYGPKRRPVSIASASGRNNMDNHQALNNALYQVTTRFCARPYRLSLGTPRECGRKQQRDTEADDQGPILPNKRADQDERSCNDGQSDSIHRKNPSTSRAGPALAQPAWIVTSYASGSTCQSSTTALSSAQRRGVGSQATYFSWRADLFGWVR